MPRFLLLALLGSAGCHSPAPAPAPPAVTSSPAPRTHPKFDVHLHLSPSSVFLAEALMDRENEVGGVNLSGGPPGRGLEQALAEAKQISDGRILVFTNIDFGGFGDAGWTEREVAALRRARDLGARGLKVFKSLGLVVRDPATGKLVAVDDPRLAPIFEEAGALGFPVTIHSGDPQAFFQADSPTNERHAELSLNPDWSFARPGYPTWEEVFSQFERVVAAHPHTTFIGAHFGNDPEDPVRVGTLLDRYPNLMVDTAARVGAIGRTDPKVLHDLFVKYRSRILFGTDWMVSAHGMTLGASNGWKEELPDLDLFFARHTRFFETWDRGLDHPTPIQGHWKVDGIGLPPEVLDDVYLGNAERLFQWQPIPFPAHQGD